MCFADEVPLRFAESGFRPSTALRPGSAGSLPLGGITPAKRLKRDPSLRSGFRLRAPASLTPAKRLKRDPSLRSGFRLRAPASLTPAKRLKRDPSLRSGFRLRAPASLTPAKRLKVNGRDNTGPWCFVPAASGESSRADERSR